MISGPSAAKDRTGIWILPVAGGNLTKLQDDAWGAAPSPDGSQIVFYRPSGRDIWLMRSSGEHASRILAAPDGYHVGPPFAWSPDGRRIAFSKRKRAGDEFSIQSYDLHTGRTSVILSDAKAGVFGWAGDGRMIYTRLEDPPNEKSSNLWQITVDTRTASVQGKPRRLTNWGGFLFASVGMSADSRRLFFVRLRFRHHVHVGELEASGTNLVNVRRFTFEEWINWPTAWSSDSRTVLFNADRDGDLDVFLQDLNLTSGHSLLSGQSEQDENRDARLSPDGRWLLYLAYPKNNRRIDSGSGRMMRIPITGGPAETVMSVNGYPGSARADPLSPLSTGRYPRFRCGSGVRSPCVISEQMQDEIVFTAFDPVKGRAGELLTVRESDLSFWDMSPDGRWIAFGKNEEASGRIRLVSLTDQTRREISAGTWTYLQSIAWAADGKALFVTAFASKGGPMLRVGLDGTAKVLYKGTKHTENPVPSPDGRYLAFSEMTEEGNGWVLEKFR